MCEAVILAGGYSSRVGTNKMLLPIDGVPVLLRVINSLKPYCEHIIVVSGHYDEELNNLLSTIPEVKVVLNKAYDLGMFSSVQCGISHIKEDFLLLPGDYPNIKPETLEQIISSEGDFVVPTYNNRRGHPILIRQKFIQPLLAEPVTSNLKVFRNRHEITYVAVEDQGILEDIDTIEDYHKLKQEIEGSL